MQNATADISILNLDDSRLSEEQKGSLCAGKKTKAQERERANPSSAQLKTSTGVSRDITRTNTINTRTLVHNFSSPTYRGREGCERGRHDIEGSNKRNKVWTVGCTALQGALNWIRVAKPEVVFELIPSNIR